LEYHRVLSSCVIPRSPLTSLILRFFICKME
jgi:hypothetical protein